MSPASTLECACGDASRLVCVRSGAGLEPLLMAAGNGDCACVSVCVVAVSVVFVVDDNDNDDGGGDGHGLTVMGER
ncbi:hypothetical protein LZ32DRAFT_606887 [Colletotrichum eremochloae]|nr:hypothetical protein LZ32DRAFT_606887 [Colletotrichum eremochloae]